MNKRILNISIVSLLIDLVTKYVVTMFLINNQLTVIPNFFYLTYATNTGAAWSILNNHQVLLVVISIILIIFLFMIKSNFKENLRNDIAFGLLYGGIAGNLMNRVFNGYVIDFLDFKIFNYDYPIFNIADILVVLGIILIIFAIFKGEDNENSSKRK